MAGRFRFTPVCCCSVKDCIVPCIPDCGLVYDGFIIDPRSTYLGEVEVPPEDWNDPGTPEYDDVPLAEHPSFVPVDLFREDEYYRCGDAGSYHHYMIILDLDGEEPHSDDAAPVLWNTPSSGWFYTQEYEPGKGEELWLAPKWNGNYVGEEWQGGWLGNEGESHHVWTPLFDECIEHIPGSHNRGLRNLKQSEIIGVAWDNYPHCSTRVTWYTIAFLPVDDEHYDICFKVQGADTPENYALAMPLNLGSLEPTDYVCTVPPPDGPCENDCGLTPLKPACGWYIDEDCEFTRNVWTTEGAANTLDSQLCGTCPGRNPALDATFVRLWGFATPQGTYNGPNPYLASSMRNEYAPAPVQRSLDCTYALNYPYPILLNSGDRGPVYEFFRGFGFSRFNPCGPGATEVQAWLQIFLDDEDRPEDDVYSSGDSFGYSPTDIVRAALAVPVHRYPDPDDGDKKWWTLDTTKGSRVAYDSGRSAEVKRWLTTLLGSGDQRVGDADGDTGTIMGLASQHDYSYTDIALAAIDLGIYAYEYEGEEYWTTDTSKGDPVSSDPRSLFYRNSLGFSRKVETSQSNPLPEQQEGETDSAYRLRINRIRPLRIQSYTTPAYADEDVSYPEAEAAIDFGSISSVPDKWCGASCSQIDHWIDTWSVPPDQVPPKTVRQFFYSLDSSCENHGERGRFNGEYYVYQLGRGCSEPDVKYARKWNVTMPLGVFTELGDPYERVAPYDGPVLGFYGGSETGGMPGRLRDLKSFISINEFGFTNIRQGYDSETCNENPVANCRIGAYGKYGQYHGISDDALGFSNWGFDITQKTIAGYYWIITLPHPTLFYGFNHGPNVADTSSPDDFWIAFWGGKCYFNRKKQIEDHPTSGDGRSADDYPLGYATWTQGGNRIFDGLSMLGGNKERFSIGDYEGRIMREDFSQRPTFKDQNTGEDLGWDRYNWFFKTASGSGYRTIEDRKNGKFYAIPQISDDAVRQVRECITKLYPHTVFAETEYGLYYLFVKMSAVILYHDKPEN